VLADEVKAQHGEPAVREQNDVANRRLIGNDGGAVDAQSHAPSGESVPSAVRKSSSIGWFIIPAALARAWSTKAALVSGCLARKALAISSPR